MKKKKKMLPKKNGAWSYTTIFAPLNPRTDLTPDVQYILSTKSSFTYNMYKIVLGYSTLHHILLRHSILRPHPHRTRNATQMEPVCVNECSHCTQATSRVCLGICARTTCVDEALMASQYSQWRFTHNAGMSCKSDAWRKEGTFRVRLHADNISVKKYLWVALERR